jgi:hypothetical protein
MGKYVIITKWHQLPLYIGQIKTNLCKFTFGILMKKETKLKLFLKRILKLVLPKVIFLNKLCMPITNLFYV